MKLETAVHSSEEELQKDKAETNGGELPTPDGIFAQLSDGHAFNAQLNLEETVDKNEHFYNDDQWYGLNAPKLAKPVFNFLARVVKFFISTIVSDDIGVQVTDFSEDEVEKPAFEMLGAQFDEIMEQTNFKRKTREIIRDSAVRGDGALHHWFDTDVPPQIVDGFEQTRGMIRCEVVDNTRLHFGNPQNTETQEQPYILLEFRRMVKDVKEMARQFGGQAESVQEDTDEERASETQEKNKVTVVRRYWKERGQDGRREVWAMEVTRTAVVRPAWNTGYSLYPVTVMQWEKVKNCFHGKAALTGYIQAQIFVNKAFAMVMKHLEAMAFPKVIYNGALIKKWDNAVGAAIKANGDPNAAVASSFRAQDMSAQVLQVIDMVIKYAREMMGASDAALGNVTPDNTSAIIATQKATAMPLELQKQDFYSFVEECVRIWLDMMAVNYGTRIVKIRVPASAINKGLQEAQQTDMQLQQVQDDSIQRIQYDFTTLRDANVHLNVDIGAATYWSELMQVQTLDSLMTNKIITDAVTYLEQMPRGYVPGKQSIIDSIKKEQEMQKQAAAMDAQAQAMRAQAAGGQVM